MSNKDKLILDPSNVIGIGKVENIEDENKPLKLIFDFIRDNSDIRLMVDLKRDDVIEVVKDGVLWVKISREYYDKARKMIDNYKGNTEVNVQTEKDKPVLIHGDDFGFILAPRVYEDEE